MDIGLEGILSEEFFGFFDVPVSAYLLGIDSDENFSDSSIDLSFSIEGIFGEEDFGNFDIPWNVDIISLSNEQSFGDLQTLLEITPYPLFTGERVTRPTAIISTLNLSSIDTGESVGSLEINRTPDVPTISLANFSSFGLSRILLLNQLVGIDSQESFNSLYIKNVFKLNEVPSEELLGTHNFSFTLNFGGVSSQESFGSLSRPININVTSIINEQSFDSLIFGSRIRLDRNGGLGIPTAQAFGSLIAILNKRLELSDISTQEGFNSLSLLFRPSLNSLVNTQNLGSVGCSFSFSVTLNNVSNFGNLRVQSPPSLFGIESQQEFGISIFSHKILSSGIPSEETFGDLRIQSSSSLFGIESQQEFGTSIFSHKILSGGIPSEEIFGDLGGIHYADVQLVGITSSQSLGSLFFGFPINFSVYLLGAEDSLAIGTPIGLFSTTIVGDVSYSLIEGDGSDDNDYFEIGGNELIIIKLLDKPSLSIRVRVSTDGDYCYEQKFTVNVTDVVSHLGIISDELFGSSSLLFNINIFNINGLENFGNLSLNFYNNIYLTSFEDIGFGSSTFVFSYDLAGIESNEQLSTSLLVDCFIYQQTISWNVDSLISVNSTISWEVGAGLQRWYRVQGCCIFPTAQGSGLGISGPYQSGGCNVSNFESTDSKCVGAGGKQLFVQNILATSVPDVCRQLEQYNMKWQVCSMQVYKNPAGPAQDSCNKLIDVPFSSYPECIEIAIQKTDVVQIEFIDSVYLSFVYEGLGTLTASGEAEITGNFAVDPRYSHEGSGGLLCGGSGIITSSWKELHEIEVDFNFEVIFIEALASAKEPVSSLSGEVRNISTLCGNCTSIPSILYSYTNLGDSYLLARFADRNSIIIPNYFTMYYNSFLRSWNSNYQISGYGETGPESWNIVFSWNCLNQKAEEDSSPYWKYSISINKLNSQENYRTKINIIFPPNDLCRLIDNFSIDFSFRLNTVTGYVENSFIDVTDYIILNDGIGLFKDSSWVADPWLDIRLSRIVLFPKYQTIDLSPIIP